MDLGTLWDSRASYDDPSMTTDTGNGYHGPTGRQDDESGQRCLNPEEGSVLKMFVLKPF